MFSRFLSAVFFISCFCHKTSSKMEGFIVGGSRVAIERYPHSAFLEMRCPSVRDSYSWICGASIINQVFTLTAAHCVNECTKRGAITVVVGHAKRTEGTFTSGYKVKIHEDYDDLSLSNDIALLRVKKPFEFSSRVKRVILMKQPRLDTEAYVAGWGTINEILSIGTNWLKFAKQTVFSKVECNKHIKEPLHQGIICAGSINGNDYAAPGDSGSALMIKGFIQIGLVSHKYSRISRSLVMYTNVSHYYDWIVTNTRKLYCG